MKCEEFEDYLNQVLDQRRRPEWDAELRLHCESCAPCRAVASGYGVLLDGFYALATPEAPGDLAVRVADELQVRPSVTARRVSLATALFVAAAAVVVAIIPLVRSGGDRANVVAHAPIQPARLDWMRLQTEARHSLDDFDALPVVGPVLHSMSNSTDPYLALAKGTGQGLASVMLYMPRIGSTPGTVAPNVGLGEPYWPERVSEGLKPVTESVSETLDLLMTTLPKSES